jgi:hypothetical protein
MRFIIAVLTIFIAISAHAESCVDLSGTYKTNRDWGNHLGPKCTRSTPVENSWFKFKQVECKTVAISIVFKFIDGMFCESDERVLTTDGQEHPSGNSYYPFYKASLTKEKLIIFDTYRYGGVTYEVITGLEDGINMAYSYGNSDHVRSPVQ